MGDLNATTARRDWDSGRFKCNYCEKYESYGTYTLCAGLMVRISYVQFSLLLLPPLHSRSFCNFMISIISLLTVHLVERTPLCLYIFYDP